MLRFLVLTAFVPVVALVAQTSRLSISSEPALPLPNLVKNSDFEADGLTPWQAVKGQESRVSLDRETAASGSQSVKVSGEAGQRPGLYQRLTFSGNIAAGAPLYVGFSARKQDPDLDAKPGAVAMQVTYADRSSAYLPLPILPNEEYDWLRLDKSQPIVKEGLKAATLYLCHYDQSGEQWFDDIVVKLGEVQLKTAAENPEGLQQVKLWSSHEGLFYDSGKLAANTKNFEKVFAAPGYATYALEVIDNKGQQSFQVYPENGLCNLSASQTLLPLGALGRLCLESKTPAKFKVNLPDGAKQKVELRLSARIDSMRLAGYTAGLRVLVNGKQLGAAELLKPKNQFTTANGREAVFSTNRGFVTYYSPAFYPISVENPYCPVSEEDRNPFNFRLDISKLVQPGENEIELICAATSPKGTLFLVVEQPHLLWNP